MAMEVTKTLSLENANLLSPSVISIEGIPYDLLDKVTDKVLNRELGMISRTFSNQLYQKSSDLWSQLRDYVYPSTEEFRKSHKAVIQDSQVISVSYVSSFDDFYEGVQSLAQEFEGSQYHTQYNGSYLLEAFIEVNNLLGIHIEYYVDGDSTRVQSYIIDEPDREIYINPVPIIDSIVEVSFKELLDPQVFKQYLDADNIIKYSYNEFKSKIESQKMSVSEVVSYLKRDLGIKYTPEIMAYDVAADDDRFDEESAKLLNMVFESLRPYSKVVQYASPLKKEITFSISAKLYYTLLSYLAYQGKIEFYKLSDFIKSVMTSQTNYSQINDGVE